MGVTISDPFLMQSDSTSVYQDNVFLGKNDVTLSNIDVIYQINDRKKRLVAPNVKILSKLDVLHIVCKVRSSNSELCQKCVFFY